MGIVIQDLSVTANGRKLLSGVSLKVEPGQCVAIIGANGAGKSTLLKAALGLIPFEGEVLLDGTSISELSRAALAQKVAFVPQRTFFPFPFTVSEFISMSNFFCRTTSKSDILGRLAEVKAERLVDRRLHELSGGELQKVLLASAIAQKPNYLLLDEPSTYLDPVQTQELEVLLHSLISDRKLGVCVVTHDIASVARYAEKALALRNGKVIFESPIKELGRERLSEVYGAMLHA